jgi:hypothetical protein
MKKITFALTLEFSDEVSKSDLEIIAKKTVETLHDGFNAEAGQGFNVNHTTEINVFSPVYNINETMKL